MKASGVFRRLTLFLIIVIVALYMACVAHNTRMEKKRKAIGGVRCTLIRGRKFPFAPAMPL